MRLFCFVAGGILGSGSVLAATWDRQLPADPRNPHTAAVIERLHADRQTETRRRWDAERRLERAEERLLLAEARAATLALAADEMRRQAAGAVPWRAVEVHDEDRIPPQMIPLP